jgi:hypothetical protein
VDTIIASFFFLDDINTIVFIIDVNDDTSIYNEVYARDYFFRLFSTRYFSPRALSRDLLQSEKIKIRFWTELYAIDGEKVFSNPWMTKLAEELKKYLLICNPLCTKSMPMPRQYVVVIIVHIL